MKFCSSCGSAVERRIPGRVTRIAQAAAGTPLVFFGGEYRGLA